jgi:hypothetical protein
VVGVHVFSSSLGGPQGNPGKGLIKTSSSYYGHLLHLSMQWGIECHNLGF